MHRSRRTEHYAFVILVAAMICGCSANTSQGPGAIPLGSSRARPSTGAVVAVWVSSESESQIAGLSTSGKTLAVIHTMSNGCSGPNGLKVDHAQNLWVACEASNAAYESGAVQEYNAGSLAAIYPEGCPASIPGCRWEGSTGFDTATDSKGHVFAALETFQYAVGSQTTTGSGFEWWSSPSSPPTLISVAHGSVVQQVFYMDVDALGNIWFTYNGCSGSACGYGLAEITNPTKPSWQFVSILTPSADEQLYGVYVSNHGKTLNVTQDEPIPEVLQYALPLSPGGTPFNVLGPTYRNKAGCGSPFSGGFDKNDGKLVQADWCGWLDVGTVASNQWVHLKDSDTVGIKGAAFVPSDK